jgi:hypothetical protein
MDLDEMKDDEAADDVVRQWQRKDRLAHIVAVVSAK